MYKFLAARSNVSGRKKSAGGGDPRKGEVFKQKRTHNVCCGFFGFLTWYLASVASSNLVLSGL